MDKLKIENYYTKLKIKKEPLCKCGVHVMKLVSIIEKKNWKHEKKGTAYVFGSSIPLNHQLSPTHE